ncbi:MAG: Ig-like domain-containing protein, partial [Lachnospiraceae bacterium]|nr:Ig-like domain-containing protein [Lachnospiraceae bacterium]
VKIDPIDVKSIGLRAVTGTAMEPGTSQQLEMTTEPSGVPARHLKWTSSAPDTVSVNSTGLVTAGSVPGDAVITAKAHNDVQASITIKVVEEKIEVDSVEIDKTSVKKDPKPGDSFRLTAVIKPADATDKTVTWESSNTEVAEIGATGIVTVRKHGETRVTVWAKKGTVSDNIILKVEKVPVKGITISTTGGDDYLVAGRTAKLTATVTPADATEQGVIWSSSDQETASVNEYGVVTAHKEGRVTITATSKDNNEISETADFIVFGGDDSLFVEFAFGSDYTYTGSAITPMVNVYYKGDLLTRDTDYSVSYKNNENANDASNVKKAPTVKVAGKTVAATAEAVFKIMPVDIGDEDLVTAQEVTVVSGKKAVPELYFGGTKLAGKDFTNPYAKDKFYNSRPITVYGKGNFTGEREIWINVKIEQEVKNQPKIKVKSFTPEKKYYNGQPRLLSDNEITIVSSTDKGKTKTPLIMDKDFYIAYPEDVINVGTVKIAVVGMGDYTGVVKKSYKIEAAKDDDVAKEGIEVTFPYSEGPHTEGGVDYDTFTYRPGGVQPYVKVAVELKSGEEETLISGRDYKVTYKDNKKAAAANKGKLSTATITFKGNYKSLKKVEKKFYIKQADLGAASVYTKDKVVTKGNVKYPLQAPIVDIDGVTVKKSEYTVIYKDGDKILDNKSKLNLSTSEKSTTVTVEIAAKMDKKSGAETGNYTGTNKEGSYVITLADAPKDLSKAKVIIQKKGDRNHKAVRKFDFTGKPIVIGEEPYEGYELYVFLGKNANDPNKVVLEKGTDYTVEYSNNVKAGKATIILNAVDESEKCFGSRAHTFNIVKGIMRWVK